MANKFYAPGEQRAAKVNDLFATVARRYDLLNDLQSFWLHRRWKRRAVALAEPHPGDRALDLCCGTGDIAQLLAQAGTDVTALDFSEAMLDVAHARIQKRHTARTPHFIQGDALNTGLTDTDFDIVTIGYGLRNLSSVDGGLAEIKRVLKPGGRLVILEFGKPSNGLWRWVYFNHLRFVTPLLGKLFCGDAPAYAYILESLQNYPSQQEIAARLTKLGFEDVRVINLLGGAMSLHAARRSKDNPSVTKA